VCVSAILLIACWLLCCIKVVDEKTGGAYYWNQTTGWKPLLQYVLLDQLDWLLGVIHTSRATAVQALIIRFIAAVAQATLVLECVGHIPAVMTGCPLPTILCCTLTLNLKQLSARCCLPLTGETTNVGEPKPLTRFRDPTYEEYYSKGQSRQNADPQDIFAPSWKEPGQPDRTMYYIFLGGVIGIFAGWTARFTH
jgi:hypothetical protein